MPLNWIEYGVYGDLVIICPKPYSIYLRGAIPPGYVVGMDKDPRVKSPY